MNTDDYKPSDKFYNAMEKAIEIVKSKRRKDVVIGKIKHILIGIDKCEDEHPDGWWQASPGAKFGAQKLDAIERYLNDVLDDGKKIPS